MILIWYATGFLARNGWITHPQRCYTPLFSCPAGTSAPRFPPKDAWCRSRHGHDPVPSHPEDGASPAAQPRKYSLCWWSRGWPCPWWSAPRCWGGSSPSPGCALGRCRWPSGRLSSAAPPSRPRESGGWGSGGWRPSASGWAAADGAAGVPPTGLAGWRCCRAAAWRCQHVGICSTCSRYKTDKCTEQTREILVAMTHLRKHRKKL